MKCLREVCSESLRVEEWEQCPAWEKAEPTTPGSAFSLKLPGGAENADKGQNKIDIKM